VNTNQQQQARELYFSTNKTQREIAQAVSVSERTIHRWVKQEEWDRLKKSIHAMPVIILENMHYQIIELQNDIANREEGKRYPTVQEAEITRKLVNCMHKMSHYPCLPQNIQMMQQFSAYVNNEDHDFAVRLVRYANNFFTGKEKYTHKPCHFEYGEKFATANGEIAALKQEIEYEQQNKSTCPPPIEGPTPQTENCPLPTADSKEDSVTLSGSRSATLPNNSTEDATTSTAHCPLPTDDSMEPDISQAHVHETQSHKGIPAREQHEKPCPQPDKTGHFPPHITDKTKAILPDGSAWIGEDMAYDPRFNGTREITNGEVFWLYKNGYISR
jgi:transposase-like protein